MVWACVGMLEDMHHGRMLMSLLSLLPGSTVIAGLVFARKSPFTLGATALLAGVTMAVAHMNFVNPEITNLVPVLKSYWLMIHVQP